MTKSTHWTPKEYRRHAGEAIEVFEERIKHEFSPEQKDWAVNALDEVYAEVFKTGKISTSGINISNMPAGKHSSVLLTQLASAIYNLRADLELQQMDDISANPQEALRATGLTYTWKLCAAEEQSVKASQANLDEEEEVDTDVNRCKKRRTSFDGNDQVRFTYWGQWRVMFWDAITNMVPEENNDVYQSVYFFLYWLSKLNQIERILTFRQSHNDNLVYCMTHVAETGTSQVVDELITTCKCNCIHFRTPKEGKSKFWFVR